jgi:lipopolysaccharide/colanic/teichoic acid biosynthesis glycosyltransferase
MPIALTLERHAMDAICRKIWAKRRNTTRVVLLGPIAVGRHLVAKLLSAPGLGLTPVALIDDGERDIGDFHQRDYRGVPVLNISPTGSVLQSLQCNLLVVATSEPDDPHPDDVALAADEVGARVTRLPRSGWTEGLLEMNEHIEDQLFAEADVAWYYPALKRGLDFIVSCICLIVLSPLFLVIALLIQVESPGPALFIQERVGANGKHFSMYKFRSMTREAEPYECSPILSEDPRITRIGRLLRRTSLDELPQLLNVFLGQMSLVGPRPEMAFIVSGYSAHQRLRLQVIPGITGLWQLSKDRVYPIHENIHHDLTYIRKRSTSLDIAILIHTLFFAMRGGV